MLPLVSVVMPTYNAEKFVEIAVESILNQTYRNFELIIIEDNSIDNTLKIIERKKDSRIRLLRNERNKGIAYSTNKGIEFSRGKYIALMDDDDISVADRLSIQVDYLEKYSDIDILGGRSNVIDEDGNLVNQGGIPRYNPRFIKASLLLQRIGGFSNGTVMIRKDFLDKYNLRYQENCYGMQDLKFFMDSSKKGNISSVSDLLLYYREHNANETKRRKQEDAEQRKATYARFQRESLEASGYKLGESKLLIINRVLSEYDGGCRNREELQSFYEVLCEIIRQAKSMKVDYCLELEQYCKLILSNQVKNLIVFE